ncbi:MAG: hypothetical protein MUO73_03970, partial [Thermoplasmata archaeon]|nr:hypothetical protein [Thermoplasmata archaeon]
MEKNNTRKEFKKSELFDLLLDFYKIATAESQSIGTQRMRLIVGSLVGLTVLFAFFGFINLPNTNIFLMMFMLMLIFALFISIGIIYTILTKVGHQHEVTALLIEEFIRDYLLEKKDEEDIKIEILNRLPYSKIK